MIINRKKITALQLLCLFITSGLLLVANKSFAAEFIINSTTTANQMSASIASNGTNYFIMWKSTENGDETTTIYGRYMSADGQLSATEHLVASYNVSAMNIGSVTSDGTDYLLLYSNGDSTPFDADGAVGEVYQRIAAGDESSIGSELMVNTQTSNIQVVPKVAYSESSDRYLSIWQDYSPGTWTTSCQVIESDGSLVNPPGEFKTYASTYNALGDVASDGNNFLIAYSTNHAIPGNNRIFTAKGRIVSSDGSFVTPEFELSTLGLENWVDDIGFDGTNYLVTMTHIANSEGDIYGRFVSADGTPSGEEFLINSTTGNHQTTSAIAYNDEAYLTCWTSYGSQDGDGSGIYGQLLDETGAKIGSEFRVNHTTNGDQQTVSITTLGTTFFLTWQGQSADNSFDIYGTLFDADNPYTFAHITNAAADTSFGEDWDLTEMNDLYTLYKSQLASVVIDGETWYYSNRDWGQSYSTGDYWVDGQYKYIYLDGFQGLTTQFVPVPEPVTIILFGLSLLPFIRYKKKS